MSMNDLISRKVAIDALSDYIHNVDKVIGTGKLSKEDCRDAAESVLEELPSAQPEPCEDAVSREAVLDKAYAYGNGLEPEGYCVNVEDIQALPSVQPEIIHCKDCAYWDNESRECSSPNYPDGYVTPAGFYCGWAERRNDE